MNRETLHIILVSFLDIFRFQSRTNERNLNLLILHELKSLIDETVVYFHDNACD